MRSSGALQAIQQLMWAAQFDFHHLDERDQSPETFDRELVVEMLKMPAKTRAYVPAAARGRHPRRKKFTTIDKAPLS
jgi:hypothetical protein